MFSQMPDSSKFYATLLERIFEGILILDANYRIQFANHLAFEKLGFTQGSIGEAIWRAIPKDFILILQFCKNLMRAAQSQKSIRFEAFFHNPNPQWIDFYLIPNGTEILVLFQDLTSQKEVERRIQENHLKLSLLAEASNHIIHQEEPKQLLDILFNELSNHLDLDAYFNYMFDHEQQKLRLTNYSGIDATEASKLEWIELGESVCGRAAKLRIKIVVEDIEKSHLPEVELLKKLGLQSCVSLPLISYGRLIGTLSFGSSKRANFNPLEIDLMETICTQVAKALERIFFLNELKNKNIALVDKNKKLLQSEKKFRDIFNGALTGMALVNKYGVIIDANPTACKISGFSQEQMILKPISSLFSKLKFRKKRREVIVYYDDGSEKILEYSITKGIIPHVNLIIFRDITHQKRAIEAIIDAKIQAENMNKLKAEFLSTMSHELRTPLNSILGYSQILLDDDRNLMNEIQRERILKILNSGRHLADLINRILEHSYLESIQPNPNIQDVHLQDAIEESIRIIHSLAEEKGITIYNNINSSENIFLKGDSTSIKQILINLLSNAIKYNKPFGKITIHHQTTPDVIFIYIDDTGIGIPPEQRELVFEPFYRIYHPEFNIEGTGIGLAIVKQLVTMMNGTIGIDRNYSEGSRFWFSLPLINP